MNSTSIHPLIADFLASLRASGRAGTAQSYAANLRKLQAWAADAGVDLERATTDQLRDYQRWLATAYRGPRDRPLAAITQATWLSAMKACYAWAYARNRVLVNPAADISMPHLPTRTSVAADHLTLQEVIALLQTQSAIVDEHRRGTRAWAGEVRHLAMLCLALATGRRSHGLLAVRVEELDLSRGELRVPTEKGRVGRVLVVAEWAISECRRYLREGRPLLRHAATSPFLFVGDAGQAVSTTAYATMVRDVVTATIRRNGDLADLPTKRISTHSLRVSFALLMLRGGCSITALNKLMLHTKLATTQLYTPLGLDDLRTALLAAHPLA
jgi:integrase/recombinase XerD